jgi:hypothetical protein
MIGTLYYDDNAGWSSPVIVGTFSGDSGNAAVAREGV